MAFFETIDIEKNYANHKALDKVSISIPEGSIYGLLGPNGAGKTSLIRIINQITAPDAGTILFNGRPLRPSDVDNIGYLPEERGLYKKMKVGEQVVYLATLKGLSKRDALKKLKYWFEKFSIEDWWDKKVEELSKGMAQKIQFIVTILHDPQLLIFDEPFSGFDPINANLLKNEILELKEKGSTIIFSTHNMSSVEEICTDISLINESKKIVEGTVSDIRETYSTNTFELIYKGDLACKADLASKFNIIKEYAEKDNNIIEVKDPNNIGANTLISSVIANNSLVSFKEIIPSMNDIFIQLVEGDKK
jgi:ABC-2 type transport system ATP-binding protein